MDSRVAGPVISQAHATLTPSGRTRLRRVLDARTAQILLAVLLTLLALAPVWLVDFPPLQDYPYHLLRVYLIIHSDEPSISKEFSVSFFPRPYMLTDCILVFLSSILSVQLAGKLLISIYIILLPASVFFLLRSVDHTKMALGFLSFIFIYNWFLVKGFLNFAFSLPLFLFALGYWWRTKDRMTLSRLVILAALIFAVYTAHLFTFAFPLFAVAVLSVCAQRRLSGLAFSLLPFLPSLALLLITLKLDVGAGNEGPIVVLYEGLISKARAALSLKYLMTFHWPGERVVLLVAVLIGAVLLAFRIRSSREHAGGWAFLVLALLFAGLYFVLPDHLLNPSLLYVANRVLVLVPLVGLVALGVPRRPPARALLVAGSAALFLAQWSGTMQTWRAADARLAEFHQAIQSIPPGSRVAFRLDTPSWGNNMKPYAFFDAYYWMDRGAPHIVQPVRAAYGFIGPLRMLQQRADAAFPVDPMRKALEICRRRADQYVVLWARTEKEGERGPLQDAGCRALLSLGRLSVFEPSGDATAAEGRRSAGFPERYDYLFVYGEDARFSAHGHDAHVPIFSGANVQVWQRVERDAAATWRAGENS